MIKTPTILVTGFLASGKTAFLKKALLKLQDWNIEIVQNEIADCINDRIAGINR